MFDKLIVKLYQWHVKRTNAKKQEASKVQQLESIKQLQHLYYFVKWVNTEGIKSRKERKVFWRNVENGQPVLENLIKRIIDAYENHLKEKK